MNRNFSEKQFIMIFCALFALCTLYLFWQNEQALDPNQGKSWWTLSFAQPQNVDSLAFTITNHTEQSLFSYEVSSSDPRNTKTSEKDIVIITPGESQTITPAIERNPLTRTTITVTTGDETMKIYR